MLQNFRQEAIPAAISALRSDGEVPTLCERYWDGGQCRIFRVDFMNGESWSVRIPIHVQADHDNIFGVLQGEKDVLKELERSKFSWAPKYHGSSITFDNLIGYPFMALSWIEGSPLVWTDKFPPCDDRSKILHQVAEMQISLIQCSREDRGTATAYFNRLVNNKLRRVRSGQLPGITEKDCIAQKELLPHVLHPELNDAPFAMDHGDLAPTNILIDTEYNVTGILDWGFAAKVPIQLAGRFPRFLQLPEPAMALSTVLQEDRKTYLTTVASQSSQAAALIFLVQSSGDVDFQHCFMESMVSKGMHRSLANLGWKLPQDATLHS